jgi:protein TonB
MRIRRLTVCGSLFVVLALFGLEARAQELLVQPGPVERRANPVTPENPMPARTLAVTPIYPPDAASIDATGRISLIVTIDELGRVAEIRRPPAPPLILSGATSDPERLRAAAEALVKASADAVRQWQYAAPANPPVTFTVGINFKPGAEPALLSSSPGAPPSLPGALAPIDRIPLASAPLPPEWGDVLRVGGTIRPPTKTAHVPPVYPPEAQQARVSGVVIMNALIDAQGRVTDARVIRSVPLLDQAALDAVRQWQFEPTLLNGVPVPVVMTVTVSFSLR